MNDLDGRQVSAKALGWDARPDGDFALYVSDLPQLRTQIGFLFVNHVDDLDYTQYVVNGIPVDPDTIQEVSFAGSVLTASAARVCQGCGFPRAEFAGTGTVPRASDGKWCSGAGCSGSGRPIPPPPRRPIPPPPGQAPRPAPPGVLPDVPFNDVQIAYRPRHPDGKADPGEIVWAKIPFEEDPTQSKDRPVLIIGRTKDGKNLVAVQLTSKDGAGRVNVGSGDWDKQSRDSFVKLDRFVQIDDKNYRREGSYMKKPAFQAIVDDLTARRNQPKVQLAVDQRNRPDVSCFGCGLPVSFASVPRSHDGKWCKGAGCQDGGGKIESTDDIAEFAKQPPHTRVSAPAEWFASDGEARASKAKANKKARENVQPSKADIAKNKAQAIKAKESGGRAGGDLRGGSKYRRLRGEALFDEFRGRKKYAPCSHCGIKTSPGGRGGFAKMEQDKILTLHEGGAYGSTTKGIPNLIPSCAGCNKSRGETPYPVRPSWESGSLSVYSSAFRITVDEASHRQLDEVIAFPLGWDDEDYDGLDGPVQGLLFIREVVGFWGSYTQFVVGGEVVDPDHMYDIDDPLVASASIMCIDCGGWTVEFAGAPRASDGKWCKGAGCSTGGAGSVDHQVIESTTPQQDMNDLVRREDRGFSDQDAAIERQQTAHDDLERADPQAVLAWESYTGDGHGPMNRALRYGPDAKGTSEDHHKLATLLDSVWDRASDDDTHSRLYRGEARGRMQSLDMKVGDEYVDRGFGSWTGNRDTAFEFADPTRMGETRGSVVTKLTNSQSLRTMPGMAWEHESIVRPGTGFRVTKIVDYTDKYDPSIVHRYMEVQAIT